MRLILLTRSIFVLLGIFSSFYANAQDCFDIFLPPNTDSINVPSLDSRVTAQGGILYPTGFDLLHSGRNLAINGPGCFILGMDIQRNVDLLGKLTGEPGGSGPLLELRGSDIMFDLNGHSLRSNRANSAISARVWGMLQEQKTKNLTFRNGLIDVGGSGIELSGWQYGGHRKNFIPSPDQLDTATKWYGPNFRKFGITNILLENLIIKSGNLAVYLVGRNNIIRHCRIEVEGHEAVALFGANNQLIDNEIIIKRSKPGPSEPAWIPPELNTGTYYSEYAAIWIRDAPGLVIRGNKIIINGIIPAKEAILLINSPDVIIEDNEIYGAKELYTTLDKTSSARAHNNRKRFGKWPEN